MPYLNFLTVVQTFSFFSLFAALSEVRQHRTAQPHCRDERRQHGGAERHRKNCLRMWRDRSRRCRRRAINRSNFLFLSLLYHTHTQTQSHFQGGTEIVIRAATGSLAQMRHVVGQFPLVREREYICFVDACRRCSLVNLDLVFSSLADARFLAAAPPNFVRKEEKERKRIGRR